MTATPKRSDITVTDGSSFHDTAETLAARYARQRITITYPKLKTRLDQFRKEAGWRPASRTSILLACDPNSEGQQRFSNMLVHAGFIPELFDYRETYISLPPGRTHGEGSPKSVISFAARLAYIVGLQARFDEDSQVLVVTHSFELCFPLANLATRVTKKGGRVGLAFFGSLLDNRWRSVGLFNGELPFEFFDLDPHSEELVGVDLMGRSIRGADTTNDPFDHY